MRLRTVFIRRHSRTVHTRSFPRRGQARDTESLLPSCRQYVLCRTYAMDGGILTSKNDMATASRPRLARVSQHQVEPSVCLFEPPQVSRPSRQSIPAYHITPSRTRSSSFRPVRRTAMPPALSQGAVRRLLVAGLGNATHPLTRHSVSLQSMVLSPPPARRAKVH